mgnify:CR=1 FL=1
MCWGARGSFTARRKSSRACRINHCIVKPTRIFTAALGRYDQMQSRSVVDFLQGKGDFRYNGPGYFQNAGDVGRITGPTGDPQGFSTTISALRINLTVREARNEFRVSVVVAPPGGAKTVQTIATKKETKAATGTSAPGAPPAGWPRCASGSARGCVFAHAG